LPAFRSYQARSTSGCADRSSAAPAGSTWRPRTSHPTWEARSGQTGYFLARVTVADRFRGLAFQAVEPGGLGYPPDQIEVFCEVRLREALELGDGDPIAIRLDDSS